MSDGDGKNFKDILKTWSHSNQYQEFTWSGEL